MFLLDSEVKRHTSRMPVSAKFIPCPKPWDPNHNGQDQIENIFLRESRCCVKINVKPSVRFAGKRQLDKLSVGQSK